MLALGIYLLLNQVDVHGGYWGWGRGSGGKFGLTMLPLLVGIGILFFNGSSAIGWIVAGLGRVIIIGGVVGSMEIHFRRTTLWNTLMILGLIAGGIGVIARSVRPMRAPDDGRRGRRDRDE